jgi:hypothetical protein
MMNLEPANDRATKSSRGRRALMLCALACVLLPALVTAQSPSAPALTNSDRAVTILKSPLYSIFGGHFFLLTVADQGSVSSATEVTIEFRDASNQRRAFTSGTVVKGRPLRLRLPMAANQGREQFSALVRLTSIANALGSQPVVSFEDIDANSLTIETKPPCAPVPSVGGGAEGNCDGNWWVTRLTLEQSTDSLD